MSAHVVKSRGEVASLLSVLNEAAPMLWTILLVSRVAARLFDPFEYMYNCLINLIVDLVKGLMSTMLFSCYNLEVVLRHWDGAGTIMEAMVPYILLCLDIYRALCARAHLPIILQ
jgi:hypothetical protein